MLPGPAGLVDYITLLLHTVSLDDVVVVVVVLRLQSFGRACAKTEVCAQIGASESPIYRLT